MSTHGSQDVNFLRQGTKVLLKPGSTSMGLVKFAEAIELSLKPKGNPCNLQPGGGTQHSCVGSVPWTVLRKGSYSSFCAKNLPPSGSSFPILPSQQCRKGHTGPPSSGTALQELQSESCGIPRSASLHSVPCVGPTQPDLPWAQPPGKAGQCPSWGTGPCWACGSIVHPRGLEEDDPGDNAQRAENTELKRAAGRIPGDQQVHLACLSLGLSFLLR